VSQIASRVTLQRSFAFYSTRYRTHSATSSTVRARLKIVDDGLDPARAEFRRSDAAVILTSTGIDGKTYFYLGDP
jgi:hypothetical protein